MCKQVKIGCVLDHCIACAFARWAMPKALLQHSDSHSHLQHDSPHVCVYAYRRLEEAVRWSAAVQKALLGMNWPEALLQWGDCQPIKDPDTGALLWRGLRVRMGMSWGQPSYKKPLNTGTQPVPADLSWCKHSEATSQLCLGLAQAVNDNACCVLLPARFHASCGYTIGPGTQRCHCTLR